MRETMKAPERAYYYRGLIERAIGHEIGRYHWVEAFSANGPNGGRLFPPMPKRDCQADARRDGYRAVFYRNRKQVKENRP